MMEEVKEVEVWRRSVRRNLGGGGQGRRIGRGKGGDEKSVEKGGGGRKIN